MTLMEATAAPDLTDAERLAELEAVVEAGLDTYVRVGRALERIRTQRLYKLRNETFREYLAERFGLSHSRGFNLCYSAQVADALEAAGERPQGADSALREFAPVLHRDGVQAAVEAFRKVAPDGVLPTATRTRAKLREVGLVERPERDVVDGMAKRISWLEQAVTRVEPHDKLLPLLGQYAMRLQAVVAALDDLAGPSVPAGEPCMRHGSRRLPNGLCKDCRRPDLTDAARAGGIAA